ncbi:MAG: cobalamin-dependent protein [Deinococcales bacterium]|jgi:methanogenic corrinoid protein MtbC1
MTNIGKYTVNEVVERTAIAAGTLRQWERRYGVPSPERSDSGYRLYSEADLRAILAMKSHIADGVPASRAAELVARSDQLRAQPIPADVFRRRLVEAFLALDEDGAERVLGEAHALHPVETVVPDVVAGAMVDIGDLWHDGRIDTTTEHFSSSFVQGWLRHLMSLAASHVHGTVVIVACAPGDHHELGALMLAVLLRRAGYAVYYVGADTPVEDLATMAQQVGAGAVMISASAERTLIALEQHADLLRTMAPRMVYGGAAFDRDPARAERLGGVYLADDVGEAVKRFDEIAGRSEAAGA